MITNMRHKLVLSLYSTVGIAGLVVFGFGLLGFCTTGLFTLFAGFTQYVAGDGAFPLGTVVLFPLAYLLVTAVGGLVAWYGIRTWYARRQAGPVDESASVAKTPLGRVVAVVIFGFFACYAAYTLYFLFGMYARDGALEAFGTTVNARITSIEPLPEVHKDAVSVHYTFTTPDGTIINDKRNQWVWQADKLKETGTIPVTYVAAEPSLHHGAREFDLQDALGLLGQYIAIFCVGVWGAGKNLGLWATGKKSGAIEDMRRLPIAPERVAREFAPATPQNSAPTMRVNLATGSRKTFGRRGA